MTLHPRDMIAAQHGAAILYQILERHETGRDFQECQAEVIGEYDFHSIPGHIRATVREIAWGFDLADRDADTVKAFESAVFNRDVKPLCKWPRLSRVIWPWTGIWF